MPALPVRSTTTAPRPARSTASALALVALCLTGAAALSVGCAHTPSAEDKVRARGHYEVAIALLDETRDPNVSAAVRDAKYRQALQELLKGEALHAGDAELQYLLASVYFLGFQRYDDAIAHAEKARELRTEEYPEADQLLGSIYLASDRPKEAIPYFERARTNLLYQTPYFAEMELGWARYKTGDPDAAVRHLNAALAVQPDLCGAYTKLAEVHESQERYAASVDALSRFLSRCDSERLAAATGPGLLSVTYYRLAMAQLKLGAEAEAAAALATCVDRFAGQPVHAECERALSLLR